MRARVARRGGTGPELCFGVHVHNDNRDRTPPPVRLEALCGPGSSGEPVVTVMLPDEDWRQARTPAVGRRPPGSKPLRR
jgi:hypothetical protein